MNRWLLTLAVAGLVLVSGAAVRADDRVETLHIGVLSDTVKDRNERIAARIEACNKLQKFGPKAKAARPALMAAMRERDSRPVEADFRYVQDEYGQYHRGVARWRDDGLVLRQAAVSALRAVGMEAADLPDVIAALKGLPEDKYHDTAGNVEVLCAELARAAGDIGPKGADATAVLLEVVRGEIEGKKNKLPCSSDTRIAAIEALGKIGSTSTDVLKVLLKARELDQNPAVREAAARALEQLTPATDEKDQRPAK